MTRKVRYVKPYDAQEKHFPGMNYAGPGTDVARRLRENVKPVDVLDRACLVHDIATEPRGPYTSKGEPRLLRAADRKLLRKTRRLIASGYTPMWKALTVASAMEALLATGARGRRGP